MDFYFSKTLSCSVQEGVDKITQLLKDEGFGIITQINVRQTLQEKIGVEFREYRILGACNPRFAHEVLLTEDKIGLFLPCNIVVQDKGDGNCEIAAINPKSTIASNGNPVLSDMSCKVTEIMDKVIRKLT